LTGGEKIAQRSVVSLSVDTSRVVDPGAQGNSDRGQNHSYFVRFREEKKGKATSTTDFYSQGGKRWEDIHAKNKGNDQNGPRVEKSITYGVLKGRGRTPEFLRFGKEKFREESEKNISLSVKEGCGFFYGTGREKRNSNSLTGGD